MGDELTVDALVGAIVDGLRAGAQPARAESEAAYLRSDLEFWGTGVPGTRAVVKAVLPAKARPAHDLAVGVAEALWAEPVHERRLAASEVLAEHARVLAPDDLVLLERLLREAKTWALVDVLAPDVVGPILAAHPDEAGAVLDRWNVDGDFWLRRSSVLSMLKLLRKDREEWPRFCRYADVLWLDTEFFVRKALGWVLRDVGRREPDLAFEWLLPRAATGSGVTMREAVKYLRPEQREAIEAARARR